MKAAIVTAFKKPLEVKQVEIPKPGVNDVLVKLIACGVCHTDLHAAHGGLKDRSLLFVVSIRFSFLLP
jgi:alcohol dehydrogenase, propanol-preferring